MIEVLRDPYFWQVLGLSMGPFAIMVLLWLVFTRAENAQEKFEDQDISFDLSAGKLSAVGWLRKYVIWPGCIISILLALVLGFVQLAPPGLWALWAARKWVVDLPGLLPFEASLAQFALAAGLAFMVVLRASLLVVRRSPAEPDYDKHISD